MNSEIAVPTRECDLCGSARASVFATLHIRSHTLNYWLCNRCGLVYLWPQPSGAELAAYYATEYRASLGGTAAPTPKNKRRSAHLAACLGKHLFLQNARVLDVGCGNGVLLHTLQQWFGWQGEGIELDRACQAYARGFGFSVYDTLDDWSAAGLLQPNVVIMSHVLEHLTQPVEFLTRIRREVLVEGGWILIEVPNLYGHWCYEYSHNFVFSAETLTETLCKGGFVLKALKRHGIPYKRSRENPDPLPGVEKGWGEPYLTFLAQATARPSAAYQVRSTARFVRLKRFLGVELPRNEILGIHRRVFRRLRSCLGT